MSKWANSYAPELFKSYSDWYDNLVENNIEITQEMRSEAFKYFNILLVKNIRVINGNKIVTIKCPDCGYEETFNISYKPMPKGTSFCYICQREHSYPEVSNGTNNN